MNERLEEHHEGCGSAAWTSKYSMLAVDEIFPAPDTRLRCFTASAQLFWLDATVRGAGTVRQQQQYGSIP